MTRRRRWRVLLIATLIASILSILWWNSPARVSPKANTTTSVLGSETTPFLLTTAYMSVSMPSDLRLKSSNETTTLPIVGQYLITAKDFRFSDQVGITIGLLNGDQLENISAIRQRMLSPDLYRPESFPFAPDGSITFTAVNGYEKDVFWSHGSLYAAVVVSGTTDRSHQLDSLLQEITNTWRWQ